MAASQVLVLTRGLSTSAAVCGKLVRPPLAVFGTDGRYAAALYSAATKEKCLDAVEKDMKSIKGFMATDKKFTEFILNPSLKKQLKREAVLSAFKKQNFNKTTLNFCEVLADNGRLNKMNAIITSFGRIMSSHRGEVVCEVVTAKPLDEAMKAELDAALKGFVKSGQNLTVTMKVDPSIIGGMLVSIGDRYADMSLASKIKNYTSLLKEAV